MFFNRRIVVTGMGLVTPLGIGLENNWAHAIAGKSGVGPITRFDASKHKSQIAGQVNNFDAGQWIEQSEIKKMDRFIHFGIAVAEMAIKDSRINLNDEKTQFRTGVIGGSGFGGGQSFEEATIKEYNKGPRLVSALLIPKFIINLAPSQVSIRSQIKGPNIGIMTACASSAHAIGEGAWMIGRNDADVIIVIGTEAPITRISVAGFGNMMALSQRNNEPQRASRPFDQDRDGFVIAEGAGCLILEELDHALKREARIYAELVGYGLSGDASHITAADPDGAARCMGMALEQSGLKIFEIDYINAHGTSTPAGDKSETDAINMLFGSYAKNIPISSTKSMTGHLLGAAGTVEAIYSIMTIQEKWIPPTINYETPDPECNLDYVPNEKRVAQVKVAMSNSFGFGGTNASLIFKEFK